MRDALGKGVSGRTSNTGKGLESKENTAHGEWPLAGTGVQEGVRDESAQKVSLKAGCKFAGQLGSHWASGEGGETGADRKTHQNGH